MQHNNQDSPLGPAPLPDIPQNQIASEGVASDSPRSLPGQEPAATPTPVMPTEQYAGFTQIPESTRRWRKPLAISLSVLVVMILAAYLGLAFFFQSHFGFNTSINSSDVSLMTEEQVHAAIAGELEGYALTISQREARTETITGSSIQLTYQPDDQVSALLEQQQPFLWFAPLFGKPVQFNIAPKITFSSERLTLMIDNLRAMNPASWQSPRDARPVFKESKYIVAEQYRGTTVNPEKVHTLIEQGISGLDSTVDLDQSGCYVDPMVLDDDQTLLADIERYNRYAPFTITYTFANASETLDASTAINWFTFSEDGTATLNEESVAIWVSEFAARHDTVAAERVFITADGKEASVSGGTYGWQIDQAAEIVAIKEALSSRAEQTREPYYLQSAASRKNQDWGETYVEINLTTQYLYYVRDGQIALESDVVTGAPWGGRSTVSGVYDVLQKSSPAVLRGPRTADGGYEWDAPVSFWIRVTWGGIGMHDANWQPRFGGDWYLYNGSHGCINMPWSNAQQLYNMIEVGTPVVLHY